MMAACAFLAAGCSKGGDGGGGGNGEITLTGGTQTEQAVYADEIQSQGAASFTTTKAWTSSIAEVALRSAVRAAAPDWVRISPANGGAGSHSINIIMDTNYSGEDRTAEITILCGDSDISITVTQKGVKADNTVPERPRLITGITESAILHSDYYDGGNGAYEPYSYEFRYDTKYRLKEYKVKNHDGSQVYNYIYNYDILDEVRITEEGETGRYVARLNSAGYAERIFNPDTYYNGYRYSDERCYGYDSNGYVVRASDSLNIGDYTKFTWSGGNISKISEVWFARPDNDDDEGGNGDDKEGGSGGPVKEDPKPGTKAQALPKLPSFESEYYYFPTYGTELNDKTNIDLNAMFFGLEYNWRSGYLFENPKAISYNSYDLLSLIGLTGKRSRNYMTSWFLEVEYVYPSGNKLREDEIPAVGTVMRTSYSREFYGVGSYTFDAKGYPTRFSHQVEVEKVTFTYNGAKQFLHQDHDGVNVYHVTFDASAPVVAYDTYTYTISYDR